MDECKALPPPGPPPPKSMVAPMRRPGMFLGLSQSLEEASAAVSLGIASEQGRIT